MQNHYGFVKLTGIEALPDYRLLATFETGERKVYDFKPLLEYEIYGRLNNPGFFRQVKAKSGGAVWNDDIDIAAEELYYRGVTPKS
jgi:hypothetical protein